MFVKLRLRNLRRCFLSFLSAPPRASCSSAAYPSEHLGEHLLLRAICGILGEQLSSVRKCLVQPLVAHTRLEYHLQQLLVLVVDLGGGGAEGAGGGGV